MKNILITGVAGLIGANFAEWLATNKPEYNIVGIDNLFGGYKEYIHPKVIFYKRDISKDSLKDIFKKYKFDYVFHFASYAAEGLSPFMRIFNYENNIISTANIINECINHSVGRLVYTSSMSVYGHSHDKDMFNETDEPKPIDPYAISKYACEMDIKVAGEQHGLDWCIIRPHNVYGKYQNIWDKYRNVLGIWMNNILHDEPMVIYGDGNQVRSFSYINDYMVPLWNAAISPEANKEIINVGSIEHTTLNDAAEILCDITGYKNVIHAEPRLEAKYCVPTWEKSISLLGFKHTTSLEEGLKKMWAWAENEPKREQFKWADYEINKGIYSYWK